MKRLLFICSVMLVLVACSPTVNYVGKAYPQADNIEVYYSKDDVKRNFETMGHAEVSVSWGNNGKRCQEALEKLARKKGADAVIIESLGTVVTTSGLGGNVSSTENTTVKATFIKYK